MLWTGASRWHGVLILSMTRPNLNPEYFPFKSNKETAHFLRRRKKDTTCRSGCGKILCGSFPIATPGRGVGGGGVGGWRGSSDFKMGDFLPPCYSITLCFPPFSLSCTRAKEGGKERKLRVWGAAEACCCTWAPAQVWQAKNKDGGGGCLQLRKWGQIRASGCPIPVLRFSCCSDGGALLPPLPHSGNTQSLDGASPTLCNCNTVGWRAIREGNWVVFSRWQLLDKKEESTKLLESQLHRIQPRVEAVRESSSRWCLWLVVDLTQDVDGE